VKRLAALAFDPVKAKAELAEFRKLLDGKQWLAEQAEILPFFQQHPQLSAVAGFHNPYLTIPDRLAHEFVIEGDFRCDLVVGDSTNREFCFIEFEEAKEDSIFRTSGRVVPTYSPLLEHGFSQIVDWFCKLRDISKSGACEDVFESREPNYAGLVVIGRSSTLDAAMRRRLTWRQKHTAIDSKSVHFLTLDDLYDHMSQRLNFT